MLSHPVRWIVVAALQFGICGSLYFLSLVAGVPFWGAVMAAVLAGLLLAWWFGKMPVGGVEKDISPKQFFVSAVLLAAGTALLLLNSFEQMERWGGWDAWAIWNHRAAMLQSPDRWRAAFSDTVSQHADYPLALPSGVAFLNRLTVAAHPEPDTVAIGVAFGATLAIAMLLFGSLYRSGRLLGCAVLFYLATSATFLKHGLSQYADTLLGLYFLIAVMSSRAAVMHRANQPAAFACGAALALCAWTKNEGCILSAVAILFWGETLLAAGSRKGFLLGALPFISVWLLFKTTLAPPGDMLGAHNLAQWGSRFADVERYRLVWIKLNDVVAASYTIPALLMAVYLVIRARLGRRPGADFGVIVAVLLIYCGIYILTPANVGWHLDTSLSRLLHQLMPSVLLVCGGELARLRVQPVEKAVG